MVALDIIGTIFEGGWTILSGLIMPGVGIFYSDYFLTLLCVTLCLAAFRIVLRFSGGSGSGYRSGGNGKRNISDKRKGDEK